MAGSLAALLTGWFVWRVADRRLQAQLGAGGADLTRQLSAGSSALSREAIEARDRAVAALEQALVEEVRPQVRREIQKTLADYGLTRERILAFEAALATLRRSGLAV